MAICKGDTAGYCLHPFGPLATMNFDSALTLLQCSSGSDSCMIANVTPVSPVAMPGLSDSSTEGELLLVVQGAVTGALHTCMAQVVQNLCTPVLREQEHASIFVASDGTIAGHTHPPSKPAIMQALTPIFKDDEHCALIGTALDEYLQHAVQGAFLLAQAPSKDTQSRTCVSYGIDLMQPA